MTNQYFIDGEFRILTHWKEEVLPYELVTFRVRNGHIFPVIDGSYWVTGSWITLWSATNETLFGNLGHVITTTWGWVRLLFILYPQIPISFRWPTVLVWQTTLLLICQPFNNSIFLYYYIYLIFNNSIFLYYYIYLIFNKSIFKLVNRGTWPSIIIPTARAVINDSGATIYSDTWMADSVRLPKKIHHVHYNVGNTSTRLI